MPIEPAGGRGLPRRDFLKVGLGFSLALTVGTAVVGCSDAAKTLSTAMSSCVLATWNCSAR